ncbi:MAG: hypothetical protein D6694_04675 [Gammaproteobacteria bacterium]|nr:MAG: hypothetical protein D6694_04675 [Gammaproteobacteria bacterium]
MDVSDSQIQNPFAQLDSIGSRLRSEFNEAVRERRQYEDRWLTNLRMYRGIYEPAVLQRLHPNQTKAFVRLTRIKVNTLNARMTDMLFPSSAERNWSIKPTPKPSIPEHDRMVIVQELSTKLGVNVDELPTDVIEDAINAWAEERAKAMSIAISDALVEGRYSRHARRAIHSGNLYGTGWIKGTLTDVIQDIRWKYDDGVGDFVAVEETRERPGFSFVPIWDVYPDLSAQSSDISQCEYIYQRHVMTKHHLQRLARRNDFHADAIMDYVKNHPDGDAQRMYHEEALRTIGSEKQGVNENRKRFEVLERWGYVDPEWLADCGCEVPDDVSGDVFGVIWLLGGRVIKAALHPSDRARHVFHKYHFEEDETSVFGLGVPDAIRDTQDLANSAIRAAVDNAAISAGPQVEVNIDLIDPAHVPQANEIYPFKTWLRRGKGDEARHKAVHVTNIEGHLNELISLFNMFKMLNDEVSNIPSYMHGEADSGVGSTVGGLSMLMGAANVTVKDVVANFDEGITVPFITSVYDWLMMFGPDDVKGDVQVRAVGSSSLVAREVRAQNLMTFAQSTANPTDGAFVDRARLLREQVKVLELPEDVLVSEEKAQEIADEVQQMAAQLMAQAMAQSAHEAPQGAMSLPEAAP